MTAKHHIDLFWSEEDGARVADVPDPKSCSAYADTPAEALAEVDRAMEGWLAAAHEDGLPIPGPHHRGAKQAAG